MKIYTKTGDQGETGFYGGGRAPKDHARIEAYGAVDELNASLGLARAESIGADLDQWLALAQANLFRLGAELATLELDKLKIRLIGASDIADIEKSIDIVEEKLQPLKTFILPAGGKAAASLHLARTICRRAERRVVTLVRESEHTIRPETMEYLNRLGDFLFVLARRANALNGLNDEPWNPN